MTDEKGLLYPGDTIAAIATPTGQGGIAILRISGPRAKEFLRKLFKGAGKGFGEGRFSSHRLMYGHLVDGDIPVDEVMAVFMAAPNTYTREDVAEIHTHGGAMAAGLAMELALKAGARPGEPGEFTKRAFLNGRIDLSQAEAVMDMISARGRMAAKAAARQLEGGASRFIREAQGKLYDLMAGLEAAVDYPEEVDEAEATGNLRAGCEALAARLEAACDQRVSRLLRQGLSVVLCGRPNVGKSSLLNALTGQDHAIVTDIPGTTRDVLTGSLDIGGIPVEISDTAGLREHGDPVEQIGIDRARRAVERADVALLVVDASQPLSTEDRDMIITPPNPRLAVVLNKGDLPSVVSEEAVRGMNGELEVMAVSAATGNGLPRLLEYLAHEASLPQETGLTNQRHMDAARRCAAHLHQAAKALEGGQPLDMAAIDLRDGLSALGEITGDEVTETLLDAVFANFCVGK